MEKQIIRDKTGHRWGVEIDEISGSIGMGMPLTLANFYLFPLSNALRKSDDPVGRGCISVKGKDINVAKIEDLEVNPDIEDRGLGSALLTLIESWAGNHGVKKLIGDLSNVDANHFNKLKHFYEKHNYTFRLNRISGKKSSILIGEVEKSLHPEV